MPGDHATSLLPAPGRFMTAAEYYELPEGPPYSQLVEGELIMSPANYARAGVREFWAVVPKTKEIEVWPLADSISEPAWRIGLGDTLTTELLPGWEMPGAEVFED